MDADCKNLLICKMDLDCVKELHFETEVIYSSDYVPRSLYSFYCLHLLVAICSLSLSLR